MCRLESKPPWGRNTEASGPVRLTRKHVYESKEAQHDLSTLLLMDSDYGLSALRAPSTFMDPNVVCFFSRKESLKSSGADAPLLQASIFRGSPLGRQRSWRQSRLTSLHDFKADHISLTSVLEHKDEVNARCSHVG